MKKIHERIRKERRAATKTPSDGKSGTTTPAIMMKKKFPLKQQTTIDEKSFVTMSKADEARLKMIKPMQKQVMQRQNRHTLTEEQLRYIYEKDKQKNLQNIKEKILKNKIKAETFFS
jgi:hypothetical protein